MDPRAKFPSSNLITAFIVILCFIAQVNGYMNNKTASMCCSHFDYVKTGMAPNCATPTDDKMKSMQQNCSAACVSYQCIDWTIGSNANAIREASFFQRTGQSVYFGVGSYGNNATRAGFCYRIKLSSVQNKEVIIQVVNQGADVSENAVDLMVADGGFGLFDACAGGPEPMYNSSKEQWGAQYGGVPTIAGCSQLPQYPVCQYNTPQDDLRTLCEFSFKVGIRMQPSNRGSTNPIIERICQVACPMELYTATGLRRSDEKPTGFTCAAGSKMEKPGGYLTRMMDCAKPSYGWAVNVKGRTYPNYSAVVPCRRDGYTRINQLSGRPTFFPTAIPSARPTTGTPSVPPTFEPTEEPTFFQTARPTEEPTFAPTYEFQPSAEPTLAPSVYNRSLPSHSLSFVRLDSSLTLTHVYLGPTIAFDMAAQKILCATIDELIGTTIGSTKISKDTIPVSKFAGNAMEKFRVESAKPIVPGYYVINVKVTTIVTALPPSYLPYLISETQAAIAVGQTILRAVDDLSVNPRLRRNANKFGAASLATANITQANVTFVPLSQQADNSVSLSSMEKVSPSAVIGVVLGVLLGTFMLVVCASTYFKYVENEKKEHIYKISSKESAPDMEVAIIPVEIVDGRSDQVRTPMSVSSPGQASSSSSKPFPSVIPATPPSPSKLSAIERSHSSTSSLTGLHDSKGRYEREILTKSNKSSSKREIIHVPSEALDDGEIIFFYDDKKKGSHDHAGIHRIASNNSISSKKSRSNFSSPSGELK